MIPFFITIGAVNLFLGLFVLLKEFKQKINRYFAAFAIFTAFLIFLDLILRINQDIFVLKIAFAFASFIPCIGVLWVSVLVEQKIINLANILIITISTALVVLSLWTELIVKDLTQVFFFGFKAEYGDLFPLLLAFLTLTIFIAFRRLIKRRKENIDPTVKMQVTYVLFGLTAFGTVATFFTLLLPILGIYSLNSLDAPSSIIFVVLTSYAVLKHNLFNIKVIATEILVFVLWLFIFISTFSSETLINQITNGSLLVLLTIFGLLLIKNVRKEVQLREKIEKLAKDLEAANERLKELDVMKTEFISFATHQIRGPLTAIKGYASLLIEGDYGQIAPEIKDPVDKIFQSSNSLTVLVEDYLNVSRIEQGRMKFEFTAFDLSKLVAQTAEELKPNIEKKGLKLNLDVDGEMPVFGDAGKIKQVISNVIDNSAKYTERGEITVTARTNPETKKALVTIKDTGVGIDPAVMPKLFQKFSRAMDASKANILGTGLGLYVARQLIEAHKGGRIWAESEGKDKGSTFSIELPLA
ncbi:MAG: hypothetical protein A3H68_02200 [Candidatus Taylorbacteria bacterium RIFCSPLOWO2_02_FULL_46_40]|uniref:histidine kinase n=1 Tax=Candidatus Taylorbacteria bacterium RIFCSPLOWO2_02_FULL_46_40 TaxID=1802329 RepID=A0A1G2NZ96_9BACT|nr:MAG: hypothetical protein A3H68_02200 [Candidatus Taylorbacteria bacterium RIFCSPLOWO2_02_FULL_46_40]